MIPASVPAEVVYTNRHGVTQTLPVHAWDDDGYAVALWRGSLQRAQSIEGFKEVRERREIIGVVPGGGWMIEWQVDGEDASFADPIVAWVVYSDGQAVPVDTDSTGEAFPVTSSSDWRVYHPDSAPHGPVPNGEDK